MLGIQVISALRDLYGRNGAETISGLCGTRVVLAAPDRDTAQWSADSLGRSEVEEVTEGFSYGANTIRDGVSLMPKRELRALALASEIMQLESLHGWLRFPGPLPVARIRLNYVQRPKVAERFVARPAAGAADGSGTGDVAGVGSSETAPKSVREARVSRSDVLDLPPLDPPGAAGPEPVGGTLPLPLAGTDEEPAGARMSTPKSGGNARKRGKREAEAKGVAKGRNASDADNGSGENRRAHVSESGAVGELSLEEPATFTGEPNEPATGMGPAQDAESSGRTAGKPSADWL